MKKLFTLCLISIGAFMSAQCPTLNPGQSYSLCNVQYVTLSSSFSPTVAANGAQYQWTVPNNAVVQGVTTRTLQTSTPGIYVLTATVIAATNCTSTAQYTVSACGNSVGVEELTMNLDNCGVFPNPGNGSFTFYNEQKVKATLYDAQGKMISIVNYEAGNHALDLTDLNNGLYILNVESGASKKSLKFIKAD